MREIYIILPGARGKQIWRYLLSTRLFFPTYFPDPKGKGKCDKLRNAGASNWLGECSIVIEAKHIKLMRPTETQKAGANQKPALACFSMCFGRPGSPFVYISDKLKFPEKRNHLHILMVCKVWLSKTTCLKPKSHYLSSTPVVGWGGYDSIKNPFSCFLMMLASTQCVVKNVRKYLGVRKIEI